MKKCAKLTSSDRIDLYLSFIKHLYSLVKSLLNILSGFIFIIVLFYGCSNDDEPSESSVKRTTEYLFESVSLAKSGLDFTNQVNESVFRNSMFFDYFLNGGGVAVGDINNDGLTDVFFTGNDVPNRLYLNKGNLHFEDITERALPKLDKWSTGVNMVDINRDGFLDIYVCNSGIEAENGRLSNNLLINNGDLTFTDKASEYNVAGSGNSVHSSFFDYDADGDLDLWVNNHVNFTGDFKQFLKNDNLPDVERQRTRSRLYRNDGDVFKDVTEKANVSKEMVGLGVVTSDLDNDGWIDVYVSNDYDVSDYYFKNNGNGTFTEVSKNQLGHTSFYSMGIDAADINNDLELDMVAVDMTPQDHIRNKVLMASMDSRKFQYLYDYLGLTKSYMFNSVQMGRGDGSFSEVGNYMGVGQTEWSWAPLIADFDNDGLKDLYITNGYYRDTKDNDFKKKVDEFKNKKGDVWNEEVFNYFKGILKSTPVKNRVFKNNSDRFEDVTTSWSDLNATFSNGAAYADFDNDGDLDIIINNLSQPVSLLENRSKGSNFLRVQLVDDESVQNSKLILESDKTTQRVDYNFSRGFQSSVEPIVHFGLGKESPKVLIVQWPDRTTEKFEELTVNSVLNIIKGKGETITKESKKNELISEVNLVGSIVMHEEMQYNDFQKEILLPHKYSDLGPGLAMSQKGRNDVQYLFLGGSNTSQAQLFNSVESGFVPIESAAILNDKRYEDLGAHFFDFDNDGDQDLYVSSGGGGEVEQFPELLQDRLYENKGNGVFESKTENLPTIESSTMAIASIDVDKDGDLDLLVGGRNSPGQYPLMAQSYFLENTNGLFRNRTKKVIKELPEMISDIEVIDLDKDGWEDLVITSEWDMPYVFINNEGTFIKKSIPGLEDASGWWQSVSSADLDGDGDIDFVIGNMGDNTKFHPNKEKPLGILASDFDNSGSLDIVLTKKYKDKTVPVRGKECSSEQMPILSEKFPTYEGFASSSIEEILGSDKIEQAYSKNINNLKSYVVENLGNGDFEAKPFIGEAQWFPILDAAFSDINKDGHLDVFLVGNKFNAEPETPSYDAGRGLILLGDGNLNFKPILNVLESGVNIISDMRNIERFTLSGENYFAVASNNGPLQFFKIN